MPPKAKQRRPREPVNFDDRVAPNATDEEYVPEANVRSKRTGGRGSRHRETEASLAQDREEIDITVSPESDDKELPAQRHPGSRSQTTDPIASTSNQRDNTHRTDPSPPPSEPSLGGSRTSSTTAHDIHHFFQLGNRATGTLTICRKCKYVATFLL